tara:strand:- start:86812 stop:87225 length:414 start_codon:yes stop_codon:yes gene_type:complete
MTPMMIGSLSKRTGTKVNTIRFYEEIGLMPRAARTQSGRRVYDQADLRRLRFIRHARKLGFEIGEIRSLLTLEEQPEHECAHVTEIALRHLTDVNEKIAQLELLRDDLKRIAGLCAGGTVSDCRIIEALAVSEAAAH